MHAGDCFTSLAMTVVARSAIYLLRETPCELCETPCPLDCFVAAAAGLPISGAITAHAPNRLSRLRGSMYSFIDTASRNSPMNVITTSTTGNAIHHQMPATSAVCWLAQ